MSCKRLLSETKTRLQSLNFVQIFVIIELIEATISLLMYLLLRVANEAGRGIQMILRDIDWSV